MENYYLGNGRRWIYTSYANEKNEIERLHNNIPDIIMTLLNKRGINSKSEINNFFKPSLENLHDPFLLNGMKAAVDRIIFSIKNNERILIYGDYDADGVSATAILIRFFKSINISVDFYIPDRADEGYGISEQAIEYISDESYDLVITVDCGISGRYQVESIKKKCSQKGKVIDFIITDHHQCNNDLIPDAIAIINPHLPNDQYPFKNLCGAGVALKLIQALRIRLGQPRAYEDYLDIVAIATIADIVELHGENRIIVKLGMAKMIENPCIGIKALIDVSLNDKKQMNTYMLSFLLAPRINAAGRMGDAGVAVRLFITDDNDEAKKLATILNNSNTKRQAVQNEIFKEAFKIIESDIKYRQEKVLIVHSQGWHNGVVGIVASKIAEKYNKPAFVFTVENGKAVGSARSIEGFNLFKAMEVHSDLFIKYGGHEQAGGLTLITENIDIFRNRINIYAEDLITANMQIPEISIDIDAKGDEINLNTAKYISMMEPFGAGNRTPVFYYKGAIIKSKKAIGKDKHLKILFEIDGQSIDGIFFGKGNWASGIFLGDRVDIIFTQEVNSFRKYEGLQIRLIDMRLTEATLGKNKYLYNAVRSLECLDCEEKWLYNGIIDNIIENDDIALNRDILTVIYKYIVSQDALMLNVADLFVQSERLRQGTKKNINVFKLIASLLVFDELGLMEVILQDAGSRKIKIPAKVEKVNLTDSKILGWLNNALQSGT